MKGLIVRLAGVFAALLLASVPASSTETITYSYDALGRLVATSTTGTAANNGQNVSTTFDPAGNRTNYTVTGVGGGGGTPSVSIANSVNGAEPGTSGVLTVTQSATSASNTVVSLAYAGTATNVSDYTRPSSVTILAGQTSATMTLTVVDDTAVEGSETVIVTLSSVTAGTATIGSPNSATNTIADNDSGGGGGGSCAVITPSAFTTSSNYQSAFSGLSGTGMRDGNYSLASSTHGTDNNGNEFVTMNLGTSQFVASAVVAPMSWGVTYLDGAVLQRSTDGANWTTVSGVSGTVSNTETSITVGANARYLRLLMTANWLGVGDFKACSSGGGGGGGTPTVLIANSVNGAEPGTNGVLTVTQSATSASNTVISLAYAGTATNVSDYTRPSSVTILAGQTSATVTLTVVDDTANEGNETVIVTLSSVTAGTATIGSPSSATNTIADNDSGGGGGGGGTPIVPANCTASSTYSNYSGLTGNCAGMRDAVYNSSSSVHATNYEANAWISIDLGSLQAVGNAVIAPIPSSFGGWGSTYLNGATLQRSDDGANWTTVGTVTSTADNVPVIVAVNATTRYLRITKSNTYVAAGDFYATAGSGGGGGGTPIVPQGYTASSNYGSYTALSGNGPGMRDGAFDTSASMHGTNNEASAWITMDLGSVQAIGSAKLAPATGFGWSATWLNGAILERSNDGSSWTAVTTVTGTTNNSISTFPVNASARYLRLRMTNNYLAAGDFYAVP